MALDSQVCQEGLDLLPSHCQWMPLAVKENESPDPVRVTFLGCASQVFSPGRIVDRLHQLHWEHPRCLLAYQVPGPPFSVYHLHEHPSAFQEYRESRPGVIPRLLRYGITFRQKRIMRVKLSDSWSE
jgi:hypothetical protein